MSVRLAVEEVEDVEIHAGFRVDLVGGARGKNRRGLRALAVVFDEGGRGPK